jgi:hypothetical protein
MLALCSYHRHLDFVPQFEELIRSKKWDEVLAMADSLASQKYEDAEQHFSANQFAALVRKYPFDPKIVKTNPKAKALKTFLMSEQKCKRMNTIFRLLEKSRDPYAAMLGRMRSFIRYVIGVEPDLSSIFDKCDFGNGASVGVHGNATHVGRKISGAWSVSPGAFMLSLEAIGSNFQLTNQLLDKRNGYYCFDYPSVFTRYKDRCEIVTYNKISFVPKTARTLRTIAVEPLLNGFVQKGIDVYLRDKLKRIGINLTDQTRNQELARLGSTNDSEDSYVTIDLKSASDSVSIGLVKSLLPEEWYYLLDSVRSVNYVSDDRKIKRYEKFCSMGNGFCFPLETLIFTAVCEACGCGVAGTDYSVYGDDIIVRKRYADSVIRSLNKIGFRVNESKTFLKGPFRESCGADWFEGKNVRPFTLDFELDSIESIFKVLNITKERERSEAFFLPVRPFLMRLAGRQNDFVRPFKGNHDSGIDGYMDEVLRSRNCHFDKKKQQWVWKELLHEPVDDLSPIHGGTDDESVWMYALLRGGVSRKDRSRFPVRLVYRRKTRTKVILTGHSGASSMWLPPIHRSLTGV